MVQDLARTWRDRASGWGTGNKAQAQDGEAQDKSIHASSLTRFDEKASRYVILHIPDGLNFETRDFFLDLESLERR